MKTYTTDLGIVLRSEPIGDNEPRTTIEFPGQACQMMGYDMINNFYNELVNSYKKVSVNRIDLAFDNCSFTIDDVTKCLLDDNLRSYFKRDTIKIYSCPFEKNDKGDIGTSGVTLGSRTSTRYMRIYDKHGFTRLELEFKHCKAQQVAEDIFIYDVEAALINAMGHIRDYVDFLDEWWEYFCNNYDRLFKTLPCTVVDKSKDDIKKWFEKQISSAFFVIATLEGSDYLQSLYDIGERKYYRSRYQGLLELDTKINI